MLHSYIMHVSESTFRNTDFDRHSRHSHRHICGAYPSISATAKTMNRLPMEACVCVYECEYICVCVCAFKDIICYSLSTYPISLSSVYFCYYLRLFPLPIINPSVFYSVNIGSNSKCITPSSIY